MTSYTPRTALVVVDVQNDFADPEGSLSVRGGLEVVQAVTRARFGPLSPYMIESCPAIILMIEPGTKKGEIFRGPPAIDMGSRHKTTSPEGFAKRRVNGAGAAALRVCRPPDPGTGARRESRPGTHSVVGTIIERFWGGTQC